MILTVDLGTSTTKAVLWSEAGALSEGRAPVSTTYGPGGRAEQDPAQWWPSVRRACRDALADAGAPRLDAIGLAAPRQTFVPVGGDGEPLGAALVWSDRRAGAQADVLANQCGGRDQVARRTGVVLDGGAVAAKVAWLAEHEPARLAAARWLLTPRDLVLTALTGTLVTDRTLASSSGLYDTEGDEVAELVGPAAGKLPEVVDSGTVVGTLTDAAAADLRLHPGVPVVIGAGDRPSEVLGSAASARCPMVSWGTTANVSVPVEARRVPMAPGLARSAGACGGWLLEGGLAAAGSLLTWLEALTATDPATLLERGAASPPGARGVVALPWPGGARAPWWRDTAGAALLGLSLHHGPGDLCRAVVEGVARDVARCLAAAAPEGVDALALAGGGTRMRLWVEIVTGVTGVPGVIRRSPEAASVGAALLAAGAVGTALDVEHLNPVVAEHIPTPAVVARYRELAAVAERTAAAVIDLDLGRDPEGRDPRRGGGGGGPR